MIRTPAAVLPLSVIALTLFTAAGALETLTAGALLRRGPGSRVAHLRYWQLCVPARALLLLATSECYHSVVGGGSEFGLKRWALFVLLRAGER